MMQKTDIFFAHPDQQEAEQLCRSVAAEAGLTASFASSFAEATAFLENAENAPGIALIAPFPSAEKKDKNTSEYVLLEKATERHLPTIALLDDSSRENALPATILRQPCFIGVYDIRRGPEPLAMKIRHLWHNRRLKTLLWADSTNDQRSIHLELQRCLFKVHSTLEAASVNAILSKNPDVALLVLAAKTESQPLLNVLAAVRARFPKTVLGVVCLVGKELAQCMPEILDSGAAACLSLPFARAELQATCTNHAAMIDHIRGLSARSEQKSRVNIALADDLRNYMNSARDSAQTLLDSLPVSGGAEQRLTVSSIYRGASDALKLLNDFVDLDSLERGSLRLNKQPERLDLLVAERLALATQTAWGKSLRIRRILTEVTCPLDRSRMGQVIDKLITNAIKATPSGKDVIIRVGKTESEAVLAVINQGHGIPPEDRPHLFKLPPAPRAGAKPNSAGLGLFLAAQFVTTHKGRIWAESKLDQETAFFIALPLNAETCASADSNGRT